MFNKPTDITTDIVRSKRYKDAVADYPESFPEDLQKLLEEANSWDKDVQKAIASDLIDRINEKRKKDSKFELDKSHAEAIVQSGNVGLLSASVWHLSVDSRELIGKALLDAHDAADPDITSKGLWDLFTISKPSMMKTGDPEAERSHFELVSTLYKHAGDRAIDKDLARLFVSQMSLHVMPKEFASHKPDDADVQLAWLRLLDPEEEYDDRHIQIVGLGNTGSFLNFTVHTGRESIAQLRKSDPQFKDPNRLLRSLCSIARSRTFEPSEALHNKVFDVFSGFLSNLESPAAFDLKPNPSILSSLSYFQPLNARGVAFALKCNPFEKDLSTIRSHAKDDRHFVAGTLSSKHSEALNYIIDHLDEFDIDHFWFTNKLIEAGKDELLCAKIDLFSDLSVEQKEALAIKLTSYQGPKINNSVYENLDKFGEINHTKLLFSNIKLGLSNLEKLKNIDYHHVAEICIDKIIDRDLEMKDFVFNLRKFPSDIPDRVLPALFSTAMTTPYNPEQDKPHPLECIAMCTYHFSTLDHDALAKRMIEIGMNIRERFLMGAYTFKDLSPSTARELSKNGNCYLILKKCDSFAYVDEDLILNAIKSDFNESDNNLGGLQKASFLEEERQRAKQLGFKIEDYLRVKDLFPEGIKPTEETYKQAFNKLEATKFWEDEENIIRPFLFGAEIFGYRSMFNFIRPFNRHDCLTNFSHVVDMCNESGIKAKTFAGQILFQVAKDTATYAEGAASTLLSQIAISFPSDIQSVINNCANCELPEIEAYAKEFSDPKKIFKSWRNLRKFNELVNFSRRQDYKDLLKELNQREDKSYYNWAYRMFTSGANVAVADIITFLNKPENFLGKADEHTADKVQDLKKTY